jgi:NAD(P)-dependent dehydrogenase (short-subunit alcohol dehydrogenase family)
MPFYPMIPEPLAMMARNPFITDLSSDGPIPYVMRQKLAKAPALSSPETLRDRTILITGASGGVGLSAARQFLGFGSRLILSVRDKSKGSEIKRQLLHEYPQSAITVFELDLASFESVKQFSKSVGDLLKGNGLDIAIMNAATTSQEWTTTLDGHEKLLQVNFLSTAFLSLLLVPFLRTGSRPGRLVIISSEAHAWSTYSPPEGKEIIADLDEDSSDFANRYNLTKMLITLWTEALSRSVDSKNLEIVMSTPGFCASELFRESQGVLLRFINLTSARSVDYGGRTHLHAASVPLTKKAQYMRDGKETL